MKHEYLEAMIELLNSGGTHSNSKNRNFTDICDKVGWEPEDILATSLTHNPVTFKTRFNLGDEYTKFKMACELIAISYTEQFNLHKNLIWNYFNLPTLTYSNTIAHKHNIYSKLLSLGKFDLYTKILGMESGEIVSTMQCEDNEILDRAVLEYKSGELEKAQDILYHRFNYYLGLELPVYGYTVEPRAFYTLATEWKPGPINIRNWFAMA